MIATLRLRGLLALLLAVGSTAHGADGTYFSHHDWELACDNTGTCRAAGYQADEAEMPVSLLLTRAAGPGTAVEGRVMVADDDESGVATLTLWVDGRNEGEIPLQDLQGPLSAAQVAAVLSTATGDGPVAWIGTDGRRWELSTRGVNAVLLKMDDTQGRIGTPGALIRKGSRAEATVPAPRPAPVVRVAPPVAQQPGDAALVNDSEGLGAALIATLASPDDCFDFADPEGDAQPLDVVRVGEHRLLVSTRCWLAAYNAGSGYWVIDDAPPWNPVLVTTMGSDFADGTIFASHKGRGIGDCWSTDEWTWDGRGFVHTSEATTGMCRLVALGGAWTLPTIVSDVRRDGAAGR